MRHLCVLLLLCLSRASSQTFGEDEMKRLADLFGTKPTPTEADLDLSPTKKPTNGGGGLTPEEREHALTLFGKPNATTDRAATNRQEELTPEERRLIEILFGKPIATSPNPTDRAATNRQEELTPEERRRFEILFGKPNATSPNPTDIAGNNTECELSDGKAGVCVLHYQCNPKTGTVNTDGTDILDMRIRDCPHYLQVCCRLEDYGQKPRQPVVVPQTCGWANPGGQSFRINNNEPESAEFAEFPWMVAVLKRSNSMTWSQSDYLGGGSIIHPSVVLTVAHKVEGKMAAEVKCRAGEYDTQTELEVNPHQERNVKKILLHEDFYRPSATNSIALLILESPYDFTDAPHIGVACMAPQPPPPGTECYSMGWGKQFADKEKYAVILKKVLLPYVSRDKCQKAMRTTRLGTHFELHPSLACAGGVPERDTCLGDGGSPLVCPIGVTDPNKEPNRFAIAGMVAWGIGCGTEVPGAYTNTPYFREWVARHMQEEGFDSSSYTYT